MVKVKGALYCVLFALFVSISHAQLRFHPPRADRPERVFGGKFVFLTVQTNVLITAYVGLCVLEHVIPSCRLQRGLTRLLHVISSSVFAVGFLMGGGYYALVHFDENTRARAKEVDGFDFYMHLLHGFPLTFVVIDTLFKEHTFMQTAPDSIVHALSSLAEGVRSSTSLTSLAEVSTALASSSTSAKGGTKHMSHAGDGRARRHVVLRKKVRRAAVRVRRSLAVQLRQGDTVVSVLYGLFYLGWSALCAWMNGGWWPYPFQQKLKPAHLAALYFAFITLVLPSLTLTARALRGRATQATRSVAGRSRGLLLRKRSGFKRSSSRLAFGAMVRSRSAAAMTQPLNVSFVPPPLSCSTQYFAHTESMSSVRGSGDACDGFTRTLSSQPRIAN